MNTIVVILLALLLISLCANVWLLKAWLLTTKELNTDEKIIKTSLEVIKNSTTKE